MNILYHHRTQGKGVEGIHIEEMRKAFVGLGNTVDIISPLEFNKAARNAEKRQGIKNYIYKYLSKLLPELFFELMEIAYNIVAYRYFVRQLRVKRYDLIYERYAIFNLAGILAAKKYNVPIIVEINYTSFTPLYRKRSLLLMPLAHWLDRKIFNKIDGFAVVSSYLKSHLVELGVRPEKIVVTTNAADTGKFNNMISAETVRKQYRIQGRKVIGFVGGFYPWHGLDLLLEAFIDLRKEIFGIILFLAGDGPMRKALEERVREAGIDSEVIFPGEIEHQKLAEYIAAFDIAVMPDSNVYGSPMKIFEYMAMGKTVVAPRLGPLEDGIVDGKEGFLFEQHNKKELTDILKKLLSDDELRKQTGERGRDNVLLNHTWKNNAEKVLSLYQQVNT